MLPTTKPFVCAAMALSVLSCAAAETVNPALWSGLKYRMTGLERGGRVTTVTGVPSQPNTFYMGSTGGGVWKTTVGTGLRACLLACWDGRPARETS
jgi:hypothetical protein